MRVLVIDTALGACTAAVFEDDRALAERSEPMGKGHQERIGGLVRDVVAEAGGGFEALHRIGVTVGPGSFTGLRVGLAFAQGLGAALGVPVVGISTLAALARSVAQDPTLSVGVIAAIDARRGQVYLQTFHDGVPTMPAVAVALEDAFDSAVASGHIAFAMVGSGCKLILEAMSRNAPPSSPDDLDLRAPDFPGDMIVNLTAEALAALTIAADPDAYPPRPLYLRAPDATPPTRLPGQPRTPTRATTPTSES